MEHLKRIGLVFILALVFNGGIQAQNPSALLEQAIYAEETLRDLNQAIVLYTRIVTDKKSDPQTAAHALNRLGKCYRKDGRIKEAEAVLSDLKTRFREQKQFIEDLEIYLSKEPILRQAPWEDGEILHYRMNGSNNLLSILESSEEKERKGWKLRNVQVNGYVRRETVTWMDSKYVPLAAQIKDYDQEIVSHLTFTRDHVEMLKSGRRTNIVSGKQPIFLGPPELYQTIFRCLPLSEGYESNFTYTLEDALSLIGVKIRVTGKQKIVVPAGTFDCYIVEIHWTETNGQPRINPPSPIRTWVSTQSPFYIVKWDSATRSSARFGTLQSISKIKKNQPAFYSDSTLGLSLSAPDGWFFSSFGKTASNRLNIFDPEGKSECYLDIDRQTGNNDPSETLTNAVDRIIMENSLLQSTPERPQYLSYQVRDDSREEIEFSGTIAARFLADLKVGGAQVSGAQARGPLVRRENLGSAAGADYVQYVYVFYFPRADSICRLYFQTSPDKFEAMKPVFDSIAKSVRIQ